MTFAIVRSENEITPKQRLGFAVNQGRPGGRTQGSHVDDLAALGKAVQLCPAHAGKFNAKAYRYEQKADLPIVRGWCDGCNEYHPACTLFMKARLGG